MSDADDWGLSTPDETMTLARIERLQRAEIDADKEAQKAARDLEEAERAMAIADEWADAAEHHVRDALRRWKPTSLEEVFAAIATRSGSRGCPYEGAAFATNGHGAMLVEGPPCVPFSANPDRGTIDEAIVRGLITKAWTPVLLTLEAKTTDLVALSDDGPEQSDPRDDPPEFHVRIAGVLYNGALLREWVVRLASAGGDEAVDLIVYGEGGPLLALGKGWRAWLMPQSSAVFSVREFPEARS